MIRINLLPEEYRKSDRTSPKVFAAVLLAVIAVCCSFGWFGVVYFGELGELEVRHREADERLKNLNQQVAYHDALATEKADFQERADTIEQISQSRILWTKILDELIDTVDNDGDADRHLVWFDGIAVTGDARGGGGPVMTLPASLQGDDVARVGYFHEDLEATPFSQFVREKSLPKAKLETDPNKVPPESLSFPLRIEFWPAKEWDKIKRGEKPQAANQRGRRR